MHTSHLAVCVTQSVKTNTPLQVHEPEGVRYRARALRKRVAVSKGRGLRYASRSDPSAMSWPLAGSEATRSGDLTAEPVPRRPQTGRTSRMCHKPARAHGARAAEADSKARPDGSSGFVAASEGRVERPLRPESWGLRPRDMPLGGCRTHADARPRTSHAAGTSSLSRAATPASPTETRHGSAPRNVSCFTGSAHSAASSGRRPPRRARSRCVGLGTTGPDESGCLFFFFCIFFSSVQQSKR